MLARNISIYVLVNDEGYIIFCSFQAKLVDLQTSKIESLKLCVCLCE